VPFWQKKTIFFENDGFVIFVKIEGVSHRCAVLNMTTAVTMFIRQTIRQGGIPFAE